MSNYKRRIVNLGSFLNNLNFSSEEEMETVFLSDGSSIEIPVSEYEAHKNYYNRIAESLKSDNQLTDFQKFQAYAKIQEGILSFNIVDNGDSVELVFNDTTSALKALRPMKAFLTRNNIEFYKVYLDNHSLMVEFKEFNASSVEKLDDTIFAFDTPQELLRYLKSRPNFYRILFDKNINKYLLGNGFENVHNDMIEKAYEQALLPPEVYEDMTNPIDYLYDNLYDEKIIPFCFVDLDKNLDKDRYEDNYSIKLNYPFGVFYFNLNIDWKDLDIIRIAGNPVSTDFLQDIK